MEKNYADVLESYMIAEEGSSQDKKKTALYGGLFLALSLAMIGEGYVKYRQSQKRKKEIEKANAAERRERQANWDKIYDQINRIHISMYNDVSKIVNKLNDPKVIKKIKDDISENFPNPKDAALRDSLLEDVYDGMFNMNKTPLPMPKELSKEWNESGIDFTITENGVPNELFEYLYPCIKSVADAIGTKYNIKITVDSHYAQLGYYPEDLAVNIK